LAIASGHAAGTQQIAQRQPVLDRERIVDSALDGSHRLVGQSLEPEDTRQGHAGADSLVGSKADDVRPVRRADITLEHAFEVAACPCLLSEEVERGSEQSLADECIGGVARLRRHRAEPLRELEGLAKLPVVDVTCPESPQGA
jgi:hypothetical protein